MPVSVACSECKREIKKPPSQIARHNFCSTNCYHLWLGKQQRKPAIVACGRCGVEFIVSPSEVHSKYGNFCSRTCLNKYRSSVMKGTKRSSCPISVRSKIATSLKGKPSYIRTPQTKNKMSNRAKELNYSERLFDANPNFKIERVAIICKTCGKVFDSKPSAAVRTKYCCKRCYYTSKELRERRAHLNRDEMFIKKVMKSLNIKPNKPEELLIALLNKYYPNEWEYTGDGKVIIDAMTPDFFNRNGHKAVRELFGDYWHTKKARTWKRTELGRIMAYKAFGIECLIIWEHELKDEQAVVAKVSQFMGSAK